MINKKRLATICHGQLYPKRMAMKYDKKVHPREFKKRDLVLRNIISILSKLAPNYKGLYMVNKVFHELHSYYQE
jgi:hypothetical protein